MRLLEYVRRSEMDRWHWYKNCAKYPMYIYQKNLHRTFSNLYEQCKTKECNGNCQHLLQNQYDQTSQPNK